VSVRKGDLTVFHEQADETTPDPGPTGDVHLARRVLELDDEAVPVVAFSRTFATGDGSNGVVEAAFRIDAVSNQERAATTAIASMFRLSLATVIIAFLVCALLILWVMRREALRERLQREQEHLAFSGVLANGIAHDFRNPMSSLRLDVQMLSRQVVRPGMDAGKVQTLCTRVLGTLDRMDKVFQEFLYLSRPSPEETEAVDLSATVRECVTMMTPRFESSGVHIDVRAPDDPVVVRSFAGSLRRAIVNVLTNAAQFSPQGGRVTIRLAVTGARARLEVEDDGPGIPRAERERVFDMFTTFRPEGTGLGLFLAKTAVERSGGTISAVDGAGPGACLRIELPLTADGEGDDA
jgi:signal transduction histidine kinase